MNQIDKFNKRYGKNEADLKAMFEIELEQTSDRLENEEKLKSAGNIEEAAAVFTTEGLSFLSNMVSKQVEQSLEKGIQEIVLKQMLNVQNQMLNIQNQIASLVEQTVEKKMTDLLLSMLAGMKKGQDQFIKQGDSALITPSIAVEPVKSIEPSTNEINDKTQIEIKNQKPKKVAKRKRRDRLRITDEERNVHQLICDEVERSGSLNAQDIRKIIEKAGFPQPDNFTIFLNRTLKLYGHIERGGKGFIQVIK